MAFFVSIPWSMRHNRDISELIGKTITGIVGANVGSDNVIIDCSDGSQYVMYHEQDCCESVEIEEVFGNVLDLVGVPIVMAECVTETGNAKDEYTDSCTWTFYKLATIKGYVTIRWYGESNGYYSEEVDFVRVKEPNDVKEN